jgi:hypothetical protein
MALDNHNERGGGMFQWGSRLHRRGWLTSGVAVLLIAVAAFIVVAADGDGGLDSVDRSAIARVVYDYKVAAASTYVVPKDLQGDILRQREVLVDRGTPVELGAGVIDQIDSSYEAALWSLGSPEFATRQLQLRAEHGLCAATTLEKNLNRKDISPLLSEEFKVQDVEPAGRGESLARVKVTMWIGDTRADGSRVESWAVYSYTMVQRDGTWKIDSELETWAYFDADYEQWGPDSPHDEGESTTN